MRRNLSIILLLASVAVLAFGIVHLFEARFEVGDNYPKYSSLRSDPLGTMAFYESLDGFSGLTARRDFSTANRLPVGDSTTYLHIAAPMSAWREIPNDTFNEIDRFVAAGGRLVITLFPVSVGPRRTADPPAPAPQPKERDPNVTTLKDRWGVEFKIVDLKREPTGRRGADNAYAPEVVHNESGLPLPETLDWHSGIVCDNVATTWKYIFMRGTHPVVIEREFGRGSVVIATDSYFLSNEAMQSARHADLLSWFVGASRYIVFDEAHLGVTEAPGIASLMRKYRLHWFMAGLIVLSALFIWKNSVSLVPSPVDERVQVYVAGKDAASGFVNLLRRSIPARDLLGACFTEWQRFVGQTGKYSTTRIQQAEAAFKAEDSLEPKDRDAVRAYQTISRILKVKSHEGRE